ncbi:hypothetical protein, partial [Klebsiella pneumoniae]|uniref:hypothetical protein n=1 Tax=Klebsiella pneumoniae TaxID=573 RepID=UPI0027315317
AFGVYAGWGVGGLHQMLPNELLQIILMLHSDYKFAVKDAFHSPLVISPKPPNEEELSYHF